MTLPYLLMLALAQAAIPPQTPATVDGAGSPTFSIPRVEEAVVIDGRLDEPAWAKAVSYTHLTLPTSDLV